MTIVRTCLFPCTQRQIRWIYRGNEADKETKGNRARVLGSTLLEASEGVIEELRQRKQREKSQVSLGRALGAVIASRKRTFLTSAWCAFFEPVATLEVGARPAKCRRSPLWCSVLFIAVSSLRASKIRRVSTGRLCKREQRRWSVAHLGWR